MFDFLSRKCGDELRDLKKSKCKIDSGGTPLVLQKAVTTAALAGMYCLCANFVLSLTIGKLGITDETVRLLSLGLITLFTMLPPSVMYLWKWKDTDLLYSGKNEKQIGKSETLLAVILGFAICAVLNFVISLTNQTNVSSGVLFHDLQGFWTAVLTVGILPAVCEELLFRKCIVGSLKKYDDLLAVLISAVIFGMLHSGITGMSFAFLSGIVLGFVRLYTGSFSAVVAVHLLNNLLALGTAAVGVFISPELKNVVFYAFGISGIIFFVLCFILLKPRKIKLYRLKENEKELFIQTLKDSPVLWGYILLAIVIKIF